MNRDECYWLMRRSCAWFIDWLLFTFVFINAVYLAAAAFSSFARIVYYMSPLLTVSAASFFFVFAEAAVLRVCGTTVGKYMLNVGIYAEDGGRPRFFRLLKRAWLFFLNGLGFGVVFVMLIAVPCSYFFYRKNRIFEWDKNSGTYAERMSGSASGRMTVFILLMIGFTYFGYTRYRIFSLLNNEKTIEKHIEQYKADAFGLINAPFIKDGELTISPQSFAFVAQTLLDRGDLLQERVAAMIETEKKMVDPSSERENDVIKQQKKQFDAFFAFVSCAVSVKGDIISFLSKTKGTYRNGPNGIEYDKGDDRYFFELRLMALNDCVDKFEKERR